MDSPPGQRRGLLIAFSVGGFFVCVGLGALGWGSWSGLFANPARALGFTLGFLMTLVALVSPVNFSSGSREDVADRRILPPLVLGSLLLFWLLPHLDRLDRWTVDGDAVRYLGLVLLTVGGVLRIWPIFVLGRRFSGLVAIQPGHELVTTGPYRYVRHPSYLGGVLAVVGWVLLFRSGVGLIMTALGVRLLVRRIESEEALLASQFGSAYQAYRQRSWRLLPGIY